MRGFESSVKVFDKGVDVNASIDRLYFEIKDIDINEDMVRAIAKQAEAERIRRAKVILAEGEHQAAQKLLEASDKLSQNPQAIQLRYLQTLAEIAGDKSSTIVFPIDLLSKLQTLLPKKEQQ